MQTETRGLQRRFCASVSPLGPDLNYSLKFATLQPPRQFICAGICSSFDLEHARVSTSETDVYEVGACPCGGGQISKTVVSQTNRWSTPQISYSIECKACSRDWRIERKFMVLRSSETESKRLSDSTRRAKTAINDLIRSIVVHHFSDFTAPTSKAEHAELLRLDLTNMSYRQYLDHKGKGGSICTAAIPLHNRAWLRAAAEQMNALKRLEELFEDDAKADHEQKLAAEKIVRAPLY